MEAKPNPLKRSFEEFSSSNPETDATDTDNTIVPRECDLKAYEVAINRNTIAVMESGTGKPVIALMMIKEIGKSLAGDNGDRKLIIFLAPTVRLVHQQYKEIKSYTGLDVEEYFGAKGVDDWNAGTWEKEIKDHDVLVMTPQIFLDALRKVFISFELFCFIVIDECHQATGNHPYAKIMKEYYSKSTNKPKILGMTASPVIRKGISSIQDYEDQVRELEYLLDSQVYIVEESTQLDKCVPSAKRTFRFYDAPHTLNLELKTKLTSIKSKFLGLLECLNSLPSLCIEADNKHKSLLDRLVDNHENILSCLDSLGVVCAQEAIKLCLESALMIQDECEVYKESIAQYQNYLREAMSILKGPSDSKKFLDVGSGAVACGQISSKLHELLEIFRSLSKDTEVLCIIFVERIITAKVIARVMDKIIDFSHFNVAYLAGSNSSVGGPSEVKTGVLESLCGGKVNLLFTMDVVEEEIDASKCSTVIRFDLPKTVQSYVKSRGQARQKDSQYIIMLERGNCDQINHISYITQSENSTINAPMNREPNDRSVKARVAKETGVAKGTHTYVVDSTGASVSATSSLSLIHRYCNKLQEDKNLFQRPIYEQLMEGNLFRCKLILPPNAAFQTITGPAAPIFHLSKQLVCLDACKKLHSLGALDDHLVPLDRKPSQDNSSSNTEALTSGPGSTKRKELHGSVAVRIMSGTWGDKLDGAIFYAYKMDFVCNIAAVKYSSFVLLLEAKLDDDVGNIEVELYLLSKFVKASISFCGQISLDAEQMAGAKCFQELIFNGLFGKLFVKFSGVRKFLFQTEEVLWNPSCMYLLLPVETMDEGNLMINWTGIQSCVSSVEFLRKNAWLHNRKPESSDWNLLADASDSVITEVDSNVNPSAGASDSVITEVDSNVIHLANQSVAVDSLKEMVVIAIHTGRIYSVLKAVANSSAESPFDGEDKDYLSFADYYHRKYGIVLKWPGQPLLLLKQSHNAHNYLVDFRDEGLSLNTKSGGKARKPQQRAHMPPELLIGTNLRTDVFKSVYLLPSVMHRLESLMLASQLREEISRHTGCVNVPSSLILEALTTLRCCERFSMERLELLGDSVLKYAVSCNLFLKNPKEHEGLLSSQRSRIICNASLHKLGTDRKLQEYIRDTSFDPRRWAAPGHRSIWPSPCTHGLDTMEVPLENKYFSEDIQLLIGKACDKGHRWMGSKTISDCVEALIGAYYVGGGLVAAIDVLKWLGIEAEFDPSLVEDAIKAASLYSYAPKTEDISALEVKLAYEFSTKGLLLEAITHETKTGLGVNYCYERLEFLGDAVLDLLITRYLYDNHKNLDPGDLTDLRSASVNNDNFAIVSVRRNLHPHLLLSSPSLESQISAFVKLVSSLNATVLPPDTKAPKLLGDLVESIAGAVLIDSKLNVKEVWRVFEPLLSPIVTPEKLELPPSRELIELCDSLGYFIKEQFIAKGGTVYGELKLQLEDVLLEGQGSGPTRKAAKGMASLQILKKLESRGISLSSKRRKLDNENVEGDGDLSNNATPENLLGSADTRHKPLESPVGSEQACDSSKVDIPVVPPIETKKGGPRNSLYALCRKLQWPMPTFETSEQKFRTPIQLGDTAGFNSFESKISLIIPGVGKIETKGEARADKKSSFDSAALLMLTELERQGKIVITAA